MNSGYGLYIVVFIDNSEVYVYGDNHDHAANKAYDRYGKIPKTVGIGVERDWKEYQEDTWSDMHDVSLDRGTR